MVNELGIIASTKATSVSTAADRVSAFFAATLGLALIFLAGFAGTDVLHNVAHDSRHSAVFPCH